MGENDSTSNKSGKDESPATRSIGGNEAPARLTQYWSRLFEWQLRDRVRVFDHERKYMDEKSDEAIPSGDNAAETFRKYLVWRQTLLVAVMPLLLISIGFSCIEVMEKFELFTEYEDPQDDFYYAIDVKPIAYAAVVSAELMNEVIVLIGVVASYRYRYTFQKSTNILLVAIIISLVAQFWPSLVQSEAKFNLEGLTIAEIALIRISDSLLHAIALIPIVIAFPRGATNAAFITFGLVPEGVTARILIVYFQPLFTCILILGASPLAQLAGDGILASSLTCFFLADVCIYLSLDDIRSAKVEALASGLKANFRKLLKIVGLILLVAWILKTVLMCDLNPNAYKADAVNMSAQETTCHVLLRMQFSKVYIANLVINFLRNLWVSKLLFTDTITRSMSNYETNTIDDLKYFRDDLTGN